MISKSEYSEVPLTCSLICMYWFNASKENPVSILVMLEVGINGATSDAGCGKPFQSGYQTLHLKLQAFSNKQHFLLYFLTSFLSTTEEVCPLRVMGSLLK